MKFKKILVTGASGQLGNYVVPALQDAGYLVTGFDKVPYPAGFANATRQVPFVQGDLSNLGDCLRALYMSEADAVVSLGAIPQLFGTSAPVCQRLRYEIRTDGRTVQPALAGRNHHGSQHHGHLHPSWTRSAEAARPPGWSTRPAFSCWVWASA